MAHQERWDGSGYPNNLKGEEIPLAGRIVAICDVFDALTSKRYYHPVSLGNPTEPSHQGDVSDPYTTERNVL